MKVVIPGLRDIIDIPFPNGKLPVCKPCKGNFTTSRAQCRLQYEHTDAAWNTTYVCVILDDSCFVPKSGGDLCLVQEDSFQFTACLIPKPKIHLRAKTGNFGGTKTPFCLACKEKNYTRFHCRGMQGHQELPWSTVCVVLSAIARVPDSDNSPAHNNMDLDVNSNTAISGSYACERKSFEHNDILQAINKKNRNESHTREISAVTSTAVESGNIQKIESRAFLMTIESNRSCELHWLVQCD